MRSAFAVQRGSQTSSAAVEDVGAVHRSADVPMPEKFLERLDVVVDFQKVVTNEDGMEEAGFESRVP